MLGRAASEPLEIPVHQTIYVLVRTDQPIVGGDGEDLLARINWEGRRFLLSDRLHGRAAVSAVLALYQAAWRHETGKDQLPEDRLHDTTLMLEQFLSASPTGEALASWVDPSPLKPRRRTRARLTPWVAVAGVFSALFLAAGGYWVWPSSTPPPGASPILQAISPMPEIDTDATMVEVAFDASAVAVSTHPTERTFIVSGADGAVKLTSHGRKNESVAWLGTMPFIQAVSADGSLLAVCDSDWNISLLDLTSGRSRRVAQAGGALQYLHFSGEGGLVWKVNGQLFQSKGGAVPLGEYDLSLSSPSDDAMVAYVRDERSGQRVDIHSADQRLLSLNLLRGERIMAIDGSIAWGQVAVVLQDATLMIYSLEGEKTLVNKMILPIQERPTRLRLAQDGRSVWVAANNLYLVDLTSRRIAGRVALPSDRSGEVIDFAVYDGGRSIAATTDSGGFVWSE